MAQEREKDEEVFAFALLGVLAAVGAFAFYVFFSAEFATFYIIAFLVGVAGLGYDPSQLKTEMEDPGEAVAFSALGYAVSMVAVSFIYRSLQGTPYASPATFLPFTASTLQIFWENLSSNILYVQVWWYAVTVAENIFVAVAENLLFFGAALGWLADAVEFHEGQRDNQIGNFLCALLMATLFGLMHLPKVYGPDYWNAFLVNPLPIMGLTTLGMVWGLLTVWVGLLPSTITHCFYNLTVVLMGVNTLGWLAAMGGLVLYGLKQHGYARLPGTLRGMICEIKK